MVDSNKNYKTIIFILAALVIILAGALIYLILGKKEETKPIEEKETVDVSKVSANLIELIKDYNVFPVYNNGETPESYDYKNIEKKRNTHMIVYYALKAAANEESICKKNEYFESECYLSVNDLDKELGINIGEQFETDELLKGIEEKDNNKFYKVVIPATEIDSKYISKDCTTNTIDNKLTIKCDIYEVISEYEPYEDKLLGTGEFIFDVANKLTYEAFTFTQK